MPRYRTEIIIPPDRYVCLQLPPGVPEGRATVTVYFNEPDDEPVRTPSTHAGEDHDDVEWWDEFDEPGPVA